MSKFYREIRSFFKFQWRNYPCTVKKAGKLYGKRHVDELLKRCDDSRFIFLFISDAVGISERELFEQIGTYLKIEVAKKVVHTDLRALPFEITLEQMRKKSFIAVVREGKFYGLICANPKVLPVRLKEIKGIRYALAPWSEIADALCKSERLYKKQGFTPPENQTSARKSQGKSFEKHRVLYIDDDPLFLGVVERFLKREGVSLEIMSNAHDAHNL